jgi:hypothetical protein
MSILKIIVATLLMHVLIASNGCVVAGLYKASGSTIISIPELSKTKGKIIFGINANAVTRRSDLVKYWGEPSAINSISAVETEYIYNINNGWVGIWGQIFIIPIPIMAPICSNNIKLTINDNIVTRATINSCNNSIEMWCSYKIPNLMDGCHYLDSNNVHDWDKYKEFYEYDQNNHMSSF